MSRTKRILLVAVIVTALLLFALALRPQPVAVDVAAVARAPLTVTVEQQGVARVVDRYLVSAPVAGLLQRIQLRAGDVSQENFEQAQAGALQARAALRSARFQVDIARHELAAVQALLQVTGTGTGAGTGEPVTVAAPIEGRVLALRQQSEAVVMPGQPLIELGDPQALEVAVDVLSSDAVRIRPGMAVRLQRWGGDELDGAVRTVEPAGFTKISALGVEEQRVWVIVDLLSPPALWERLGDGYRVEASFILWHGDDVLQVPESALFREGDGWAVFVVRDGRAELRQVRPGARAGLRTQIVEGLQRGERVIVHPDGAVVPGGRVEVRR